MKANKLIWIFAMVLLISIPSAFAAPAIFGNAYFILAVNILIVWIVLSIIVSFISEKYNKIKPILWLAALALAVLIAWKFGRGSMYIWQVAELAPYINEYFIVNTLIIGAVGYFLIGFIYEPKTPQSKYGLPIMTLLIAGLIAQNIGNDWVFKSSHVKEGYNYLFAPEHTETDSSGKSVSVGGILRPEGPTSNPPGKYRLLVFATAVIVFSWFLISFLNITTGGNKLSITMAIIIAASLSHRGESIDMVRNIAEVLSFLIVLKQIPADIFAIGGSLPGLPGAAQSLLGGLGAGLRYAVAVVVVSWIFCSAFNASILGPIVGHLPFVNKLPIPICGAKTCTGSVPGECSSGFECDKPNKRCIRIPSSTGGGGSGGGGSGTGPGGKPAICSKFSSLPGC